MPLPPAPAALDALLRGVSRSFYLSIRLLPAPLRRPVGLAYLLARATDTVADTAAVPVGERQALLVALGDAIALAHAPGGLQAQADAFAAQQSDAHERALMLRLDAALDALAALAPADRAEVQAVLAHIVGGQQLDLARFPRGDPPAALPDAAALDDYTYRVAGCVGEFWTALCLQHLPDFATRSEAEMRALGRRFGCGLQLVNILRDAGADLAGGRCYFPADELAAIGVQPAELAAAPGRLLPVWQRWHALACERMDDGMAYALAVNARRPRAAVALPALLGLQTLALLRSAGPRALDSRIKVPRRAVHALLLRLSVTLASRGALRAQWQALRGTHTGWDNRAR